MKLQYKANKKAKFDPSAPRTILEVQQQKAQTAGQGAEQLAGDGPSTSQPAIQGLAFNLSGGSSKREELLARLHAKVEEQRKAREAKAGAVQQAKDWRNNALQTSVKQKQQQQESAQNKKRKADEQLQSVKPKQQVPKGGNQQQQQQQGEAKAQQGGKSGASVAADFAFGRIELDEDARRGGKQQQKRPSKEILLKQAESKKAQLEALAGSNEGKAMAQNLAWKTALGRAKGDKVLDDPKLLRKSLKKDAKQKEKSSAAWRERVQAQTEGQQARQEKRTNNLQVGLPGGMQSQWAGRVKSCAARRCLVGLMVSKC